MPNNYTPFFWLIYSKECINFDKFNTPFVIKFFQIPLGRAKITYCIFDFSVPKIAVLRGYFVLLALEKC